MKDIHGMGLFLIFFSVLINFFFKIILLFCVYGYFACLCARAEMGAGQGPLFKRGPSECAREVLLVAATGDPSCQDLKGRPVQMPEY